MKTKVCSTCAKSQPISNYHKKSVAPDGHTNVCKSCCKVYNKKWRSENRGKLRLDKARDYKENSDRYKERASKWKQENRPRATELNARRRAGRASATTNHSEVRGMYTLAQKLSEFTGSDLQVDHIEPLVHNEVCGLHAGVNLQLLDTKENARKGNSRAYTTPIDRLLSMSQEYVRKYGNF